MNNREAQQRDRLFTRRALILAGGKLGLLSTLVGRLYYLQVVEADRYQMLADENRINWRLLAPPRGRILDRFGEPLALNRLNYRLVIVSEQARNLETALDRVGQVVTLSEFDKRRALREGRRRRSFVPILLREDLSWDEVARIEANAPELPGVAIDVGQSRAYPHTEAVGHVLGYVGAVADGDLTGDPLLELPGFRIGKNGIEKVYEKEMRGTGGSSQVEVNAVGRVIRELSRQAGQTGKDVELTLDIELQEFIRQRIGEDSASCVVMDVHGGELLALVSAPAYDPNLFAAGISARDWEELLSNPKTPLINKSIAGQYPPGSTYKMVTALAALDAGVVNANTVVHCPGSMEFGDQLFHCWKKEGHGGVNLHEGMKVSCDVYFYELARRTGVDRMTAMARRLGFGQRLGVDLPGEKAGLTPTREWHAQRFGRMWPQGEALNAGIGQGFVLTTPLQLATMTARLVNGGMAVQPHLLRAIAGKPAVAGPYPSIGLNPQHLQAMVRAMAGVCNEENGTGYKLRITQPGLEMGGKSGTAQVKRITMQEREKGVRKNEDRPWRDRDHALFVAFAPVASPRYACAVIVEHGGSGSSVAAPICRDVLLEVQRRDPLRKAPSPSPGRVAGLDPKGRRE